MDEKGDGRWESGLFSWLSFPSRLVDRSTWKEKFSGHLPDMFGGWKLKIISFLFLTIRTLVFLITHTAMGSLYVVSWLP